MSENIERALGRIEGKLDLLIPAIEAQERRIGQVSSRVSKLEKHQKWTAGFAAALALVAGKAWTLLAHR